MPSSAAIAAAVAGWSPVIMIGRMPGRRAGHRAGASGRGGSIIPTTPSQTSSCSTSSEARPVHGSRLERAVGHAERPQRLAGQRLDGRQDLLAALLVSSGRLLAAAHSLQRASSTSGAPFESRTPSSCSASRFAVVISLRSDENGTSPTREEAPASASAPPDLARRHDQRALGRVAQDRPAAVLLLERGVVRQRRRRSARRTSSSSASSSSGPPPFAAARRPARSRCRSGRSAHWRSPPRAPSSRSGSASRSCRSRSRSSSRASRPPTSLRTITFRFAIRCIPSESTIVVTAVRPSGTAATASETASSSTVDQPSADRIPSVSRIVRPRPRPRSRSTAMPSSLPTRSSSRCSGVDSSSVSWSEPGDLAKLGRRSGGRDHRPAAAGGHRRPAEEHLLAVADADLLVDRATCPWRPGCSRRSAPTRRPAARSTPAPGHRPRRCRPPRAAGRRPAPARRWARPLLPVAEHASGGRGHRLERRDRLLGAALLHEAQHAVQDHDRQDQSASYGMGDSRSIHQATNETTVATSSRTRRTRERKGGQAGPEGRAGGRSLGGGGSAVALQAAGDLTGREAALRVGAEVGDHVRCGAAILRRAISWIWHVQRSGHRGCRRRGGTDTLGRATVHSHSARQACP